MSDEDGVALIQSITVSSEAHDEPENLPVATSLSNHLINPVKKVESTNFVCDISEVENDTGFGYESDDTSAEVTPIDNQMYMATLPKAMYVIEQESNDDIEVSDRNMVEFETKLPEDITTLEHQNLLHTGQLGRISFRHKMEQTSF